jgi:CubicO group peptidase (beta-lactamase class C family)
MSDSDLPALSRKHSSAVRAYADVDQRIAGLVEHLLAERGEIGLQVCVMRRGERIIDVAGGVSDIESARAVDGDTLFPVFSVTKALVATLALALLSRDRLSLTSPIAEHWPAFEVPSKREVTLEHLLTHSAGLPLMPANVSVEDMCDWDHMVALVGELEPIWEPGASVGYHAYTYGWLVGEVIRRSLGTDDTVGDLVRSMVGDPCGASDFWIGTPGDQHDRIVTLYKDPPTPGARSDLLLQAIPAHLATGQDVFGRPDVRRSCMPAAGGIGSARSIAAVFDMLANDGTTNGTEVIAPDWVNQGALARRDEQDVVLNARLGRGLGYYVTATANTEQGPPFEAGRRTLGHPGSGGSIAWADRELGTGFAITRSRMTALGWNDPAIQDLARAATAATESFLDR